MFNSLQSCLTTPTGLMIIITLLLLFVVPADAGKVRIKDICDFQNNQEVDLLGYGLIVGLDGTGDGSGTQFTRQSLVNMIQRMGLTVDQNKVKVKNIAAVMVTANVTSMQTEGSSLDVTVSSIGDASSLQGGTLLLTPLSDPNGVVRVVAQGPVSIGGFNVQVDDGNKIVNNYTLVGRVPGGGRVSDPIPASPDSEREMILSLHNPDATTAHRVAQRINIKYGETAYPENGGSVRLVIPDTLTHPALRMRFISDVGLLRVTPDNIARVVVNEKTGTIVAGRHVTIDPVAVAHGTITVNIQSRPVISQPGAFSAGETIFTQEPTISINDEKARVVNLPAAVYLSDITNALNKIGATPRDIIAIFQALKQAGALHAELVIL